ncbi:MAG TPA: DUF4214 domain-containing protein [Acidimicrobiales bacterium]|nr:DUF4214 domain-containing protein [Acidimicrobiales bacterium]
MADNSRTWRRVAAVLISCALVGSVAACDGFPLAPTAVGGSTVTLEGWGVAKASTMEHFFQYSTSASFPAGSTTSTAVQTSSGLTVGTGAPFDQAVTGLTANTRYYYRPCGRPQGSTVVDCAGTASFITSTRTNPARGPWDTVLGLGDAKVVLVDGTFYASGDALAGECNFFQSANGQNWTRIDDKPCSKAAGGHSVAQSYPTNDDHLPNHDDNQDVTGWGVEVTKIGTRWVVATAGQHVQGAGHHRGAIFIGTAPSPTGPWTWGTGPTVDSPNYTYIDPSLFEDPKTGKVWLTWTRHHDTFTPWDPNDSGNDNQLMAQELDAASLRRVADNSTATVLLDSAWNPQNSWENLDADKNIIEGQGLFYYDGRYFLHYATGWVNHVTGPSYEYQMNITSRDSFPGAFAKAPAPMMAGTSGGSWVNPGHGSVFVDGGGTVWAAVSPWADEELPCPTGQLCGRKLFFQRLDYNRNAKTFSVAPSGRVTVAAMGVAVPTDSPLGAGIGPFTSGSAYDNARDFVAQQYEDVLRRTPSTASRNKWAADIISGQLDGDGLIRTFLNTEEFQDRGPEVLRAYRALLGRAADLPGYDYWYGRLASGTSLETMASSFSNSSEFHGLYDGLTNGQFVDAIYQNILGRAPDTAGRNFWISELNGGRSRGSVALAVSRSSEYVHDTEVAVTIDALYLSLLARTPTSTERTAATTALTSGTPRTDLVRDLRTSTEYANRV